MTSELAPLPSWDSEATWRTFETDDFHTEVRGVELQKCQPDLDRYRVLIEESQPDVVIEIGTRRGGSALWFAEQDLRVISVDRDPNAGEEARRVTSKQRIDWLTYNSVDARLGFELTARITQGERVMVSLDGDHHQDHVMGEITLWSPFVTPGCYLVVEDGCFDMWPADRARVGGAQIPERGGPLGAIRRMHPLLLANGFWRDEVLESGPISHSPVGWWRRD
jgi:cephalosporin hydroxylase